MITLISADPNISKENEMKRNSNFNLNREQELALIEIGMNTLLRSLPYMMADSKPKPAAKKEKKSKQKRFMSIAARKAISRRMKAVWAAKRAGK